MSDHFFIQLSPEFHLTAEEHSSSKEHVLRFCATHPMHLGETLQESEKNLVRFQLQSFVSAHSRNRFAVVEEEAEPLSLWLGADLFSRLQPFSV